MPSPTTKKKAARELAEGKSESTAAGEFVREEMHHIREGKHGARNTKQAIAIGLSKARRAGVDVKPGATASKRTRKKAAQDRARAGKPTNPRGAARKPGVPARRAPPRAAQRRRGDVARAGAQRPEAQATLRTRSRHTVSTRRCR
jgi:hypothetical protein